jgi:hypothetical protein
LLAARRRTAESISSNVAAGFGAGKTWHRSSMPNVADAFRTRAQAIAGTSDSFVPKALRLV